MTPENPSADYVTFFCKGYCGRFVVVVTLADLVQAVLTNKYKNCADFCDSFFCDECEATFTLALENLDVKPLTLNDESQPN